MIKRPTHGASAQHISQTIKQTSNFPRSYGKPQLVSLSYAIKQHIIVLRSNFQLSIYLYLRSHKPHILDTVPCFTSPGPQPKSPILQDSMSSYVFAAVNIILAAMWGEVHTCSRLTFGFSKGSISESIDSNCFNFMLPLLQ